MDSMYPLLMVCFHGDPWRNDHQKRLHVVEDHQQSRQRLHSLLLEASAAHGGRNSVKFEIAKVGYKYGFVYYIRVMYNM